MFKTIFPTSFYWCFDIPNFDEVKNYVNKQNNINNTKTWGKDCKVDTILLEAKETQFLLKPSFDLFSQYAFSKSVNVKMNNPWINLYKRDYFQEIHDHKSDIASVFFINDGEYFSKFYFYNRYNNCASNSLINLVEEVNQNDQYIPEYKEGQVIFFPGTMLHGVSPHQSDVIRKTLSCNFDIVNF